MFSKSNYKAQDSKISLLLCLHSGADPENSVGGATMLCNHKVITELGYVVRGKQQIRAKAEEQLKRLDR